MSNGIRDAVIAAEKYLTEHPDEARYTDNEARAVLSGGLAVSVVSPEGFSVSTDMAPSVGGGGTAPSPGWLLRAAQASCLATFIALRAAREGLAVTRVEVIVDSESDDRGTLGLDDSLPAGPISSRARVRIESDAPRDQLEAIVRWADEHCPVQDAVRRAVETRVEIS
jgi:uncharacterized OsmC-like protein